MQLESGKIIAIRSTAKPGQSTETGQTSTSTPNIENANSNPGNPTPAASKVESDDDECVMTSITYPTSKPPMTNTNVNAPPFNFPSTSATNNIPQQQQQVPATIDLPREKPVFKPNLVQRKPRTTPEIQNQSFGSQSHATTSNGGGQYNYNQNYANYDSLQRPTSLPHNSVANTFSHANAQNFSNYQRK